MPNHCENDLYVSGPAEELQAFIEFAQGPRGSTASLQEVLPLSAHKFVPVPDEFWQNDYLCATCGHRQPEGQGPEPISNQCPNGCEGHMKAAYNRGGYEWCIANWGTKWGLYEVEVLEEDPAQGRLEYTFQTAWSPPIPVVEAMAKRYPKLTFALDYFESGGGFMGSCEYQHGDEGESGSAPYHGPRGG